MTLKVQQSEATASLRRLLFVLVDIGDGFTKETGLSSGFTIDISKAGASQGSGAGSITEIGDGEYYYECTAGEVDTLGFLAISIRHANCRDVDGELQIIAYDPYSVTNLGLTNLSGIFGKLPTNYIMGSAVLTDKDDDIDQILTDIGNLNNITAAAVWAVGTKEITGGALTTPNDYKATGFSVPNEYDTVIAALQTDLDNPTQYQATGFSVHSAADVWTAGSRALSTPGDYMANVSALALEATVAALNNFDYTSQNVTVGTNSDKTGYSISGTITTFDAMDTNLDTQHGAGSWLTGGGGAGANILVIPSIPKNIDLADTKAVRIALYLTDQNDDLPTTGEITPGTIKIDRSADGGTSWSTIRNDVACSEHAGAVYYDEIFSSGNGYASADMIRITFKGQIVTISANDHVITEPTNGMVFTTRIDSGLSGGGPSAGDIADAVWNEPIADHTNSAQFGGKNQLVVPSETLADYKSTGFSVPNEYDTVIAALQTDLDNPTQYQATGFATSGALATVDSNVDLLIYDADRLVYGGSVWLDDTAANTNTVLGIDGTWYNPVSTLAAALTIATALNVQSLTLMNNTSISLSQSFANWEITGFGHGNIVTLNSQSIDNAKLTNLEVTGTQGGSACAFFFNCHLDSIINLNACGKFCMFIGNSTLVASSEVFFFDFCSSAVPGNNTPILTFSAGTTAVGFRHYSGGLEVKSMTADHVMSYETKGQIIINADCTGGAISIRGNMTITDNADGRVTLTQGAALNRDAIADAIWDEILTGATHNLDTSAGKRLRQLEEGLVIHTGVAQGATSLSITLAGTASSVTDFYEHCLCVITSGTGIGQARRIDTYNGTSNVADILLAWKTTPVNGDEYEIIVDAASHVAHLHTEALDEIADAVLEEAVSDHVGAGSLGEFIRRIVGLAFDNAAWEFGFTGDNQTGGGIWLYDTAGNLATHNKSTGLIGEYTFTCTFTGDKPQVMKISKVS